MSPESSEAVFCRLLTYTVIPAQAVITYTSYHLFTYYLWRSGSAMVATQLPRAAQAKKPKLCPSCPLQASFYLYSKLLCSLLPRLTGIFFLNEV